MAILKLLKFHNRNFMKKINIIALSLFAITLGKTSLAQSGQSQFKEVKLYGVPKPVAPANLVVSELTFSDARGNLNNALDANETAEIAFVIENNGQGDAYRVKVSIVDSANVKGVNYLKEIPVGTLPVGKKINIVIPITGTTDLVSSKTNFGISITEGNKFDVDPFSIAFTTNEYKKSIISIVDSKFESSDDDNKFSRGEIIQLTILLQNKGEGDAKNVVIEFQNPTEVFTAYNKQNKFQVSELKSNESKEIKYEFFTNKIYSSPNVPIQIKVAENFNKLVLSETKSVGIDLGKSSLAKVNVQDIKQEKTTISSVSLVPDVDRDIPLAKMKYKKRIALIIGNEDYSSFQPGLSKEVNVDFAKNDAKIFKEYCEKTLGVLPENITLLTNATYGSMKQSIDRVNKLLKNSEGDLEVIFYYAGHGLPDEATKEAYLIPVDISGSNVQSAIKLQDVYKSFSEYESIGVTMFIDACFSGGARGEQMVKARGVKIVPKSDLIDGNIISFTASSGNQSSNPYLEKKHGLFTYFLLKSLQETKGNISYKDFWNGLRKKVSFESVNINNKEQEPQIIIGEKAKATWENLQINY
jgi:hypothetical protein